MCGDQIEVSGSAWERAVSGSDHMPGAHTSGTATSQHPPASKQCTLLVTHCGLCQYLLKQSSHFLLFNHSFIHSIGMCRIRRFLAVQRSFFHFSLLCTFSCHPSPPTILPSSLTASCHLFLDYTLITNLIHWLLFIPKILLSSTCFEHQVLIFRRT